MKTKNANGYTYRRLVRYGDCDASRNYYTPRAIEYAVAAVEGWFEEVLELSWSELAARYHCNVDFARVQCQFRGTLTAGDLVLARVEVASCCAAGIVFCVSAQKESGESCFLATMTVRLVDRNRFHLVPIPSHYRHLVERYRGDGAGYRAVADGAALPAGPPLSRLPEARDGLPFSIERRVAHGECGATGTVPPPRVFDYLLDATGEWYQKVAGISWIEQNAALRGQPFLGITCDYLRPVAAGERITIAVTVTRLGNSSIVYAATGIDAEGVPRFRAELAACYVVHENGAMKPTPFPDELRRRITAYQGACDSL